MKGFIPTAESHGFSPDLLWSGLRSGCRVTKSRRSRSESAKPSVATGLPCGSTGITGNEWFTFLFSAATFTENTPPEGRRAGPPETRRVNLEPKSVILLCEMWQIFNLEQNKCLFLFPD